MLRREACLVSGWRPLPARHRILACAEQGYNVERTANGMPHPNVEHDMRFKDQEVGADGQARLRVVSKEG